MSEVKIIVDVLELRYVIAIVLGKRFHVGLVVKLRSECLPGLFNSVGI